MSILHPDEFASEDTLRFPKDDLGDSSTKKLFMGHLSEHPKEYYATAEDVPPNSNGPQEAVNNNNNVEVVGNDKVTNVYDFMNAIEDSNNNDMESVSSDHRDTEGMKVGKSSTVSSVLTNQEICSDQQNSISNSYSMTVDCHLNLQQYDKSFQVIKLSSYLQDIARPLKHGERSSEGTSDRPISPTGDFPPCFPERSKDHSSCSMTYSDVTVSCEKYLLLYAKNIVKYPTKCTEESLKVSWNLFYNGYIHTSKSHVGTIVRVGSVLE